MLDLFLALFGHVDSEFRESAADIDSYELPRPREHFNFELLHYFTNKLLFKRVSY